MLLRTLILGIAATAFLTLGGAAHAQYPPPDGAVTLSPADPIPDLGSTTTLTVAVVDSAGDGVADAVCTATITSQPGTTASIANSDVVTDANGVATIEVSVGDTAGQVIVGITCGDLEASIVLSAGIAPGPPDTGSGGIPAGEGSGPFGLFPIGGAMLVVLAAALIGAAALRKRQTS